MWHVSLELELSSRIHWKEKHWRWSAQSNLNGILGGKQKIRLTNPKPFSLSWSRMILSLFRYKIPGRDRSWLRRPSRKLKWLFGSTFFDTVCEKAMTEYPTSKEIVQPTLFVWQGMIVERLTVDQYINSCFESIYLRDTEGGLSFRVLWLLPFLWNVLRGLRHWHIKVKIHRSNENAYFWSWDRNLEFGMNN